MEPGERGSVLGGLGRVEGGGNCGQNVLETKSKEINLLICLSLYSVQ